MFSEPLDWSPGSIGGEIDPSYFQRQRLLRADLEYGADLPDNVVRRQKMSICEVELVVPPRARSRHAMATVNSEGQVFPGVDRVRIR